MDKKLLKPASPEEKLLLETMEFISADEAKAFLYDKIFSKWHHMQRLLQEVHIVVKPDPHDESINNIYLEDTSLLTDKHQDKTLARFMHNVYKLTPLAIELIVSEDPALSINSNKSTLPPVEELTHRFQQQVRQAAPLITYLD